MTHTTPAHARATANQLKGIGLNGVAEALRSLADQLEAATEKRDFAVESAKGTAELCVQAIADLTAVTEERDAYKLDAERYQY